MQYILPSSPHFPLCDTSVSGFAVLFRNPGTLAQYIGHARKGEALLQVEPNLSVRLFASINRAVRAFHVPAPMPRFRGPAVKKLLMLALQEGDIEATRLYIPAYGFLFRVVDECLPIQMDGRSRLHQDDPNWHSQVRISQSHTAVVLRTRKNARSGAIIKRRCLCGGRKGLFLRGLRAEVSG